MTNGSENMSVDAYRSFAEAQDDTKINNQLIINQKMKAIFKVTAQGEAYAVQSQKAEGGQLMKCEYNGQVYQDIVVNEIVKLNN